MTLISSWVPTTDTFGARLALVRHQMGWNMAEAAKACGVSESTWGGWERDGRSPHGLAQVAAAIARASGCDDVWLMKGKEQTRDYKGPVSTVWAPSARRTPPTRTGNRAPRGRDR